MDPKNNDSRNRNNTPNDGKQPRSRIWVTLLFTLIIVLIIGFISKAIVGSNYKEVTFSDFLDAKDSGINYKYNPGRGDVFSPLPVGRLVRVAVLLLHL